PPVPRLWALVSSLLALLDQRVHVSQRCHFRFLCPRPAFLCRRHHGISWCLGKIEGAQQIALLRQTLSEDRTQTRVGGNAHDVCRDGDDGVAQVAGDGNPCLVLLEGYERRIVYPACGGGVGGRRVPVDEKTAASRGVDHRLGRQSRSFIGLRVVL